jgi:hypothetical protein
MAEQLALKVTPDEGLSITFDVRVETLLALVGENWDEGTQLRIITRPGWIEVRKVDE